MSQGTRVDDTSQVLPLQVHIRQRDMLNLMQSHGTDFDVFHFLRVYNFVSNACRNQKSHVFCTVFLCDGISVGVLKLASRGIFYYQFLY